jgi:hypothetical protein
MSKPPIRGTQSFVAIMGQVWRRPSLTALEIAWRWLAGLALFLSSGLATRIQTPNFQDRTALLSSLTVFQPVIAIHNITIVAADIFQGVAPLLLWLFPLAFLLWNLIAALGRTIVLSHLDPKLHARRLTLFLLGTLRALLLLGRRPRCRLPLAPSLKSYSRLRSSQYTQLIARPLSFASSTCFSVVLPCTAPLTEVLALAAEGHHPVGRPVERV